MKNSEIQYEFKERGINIHCLSRVSGDKSCSSTNVE